MAGICHANSLPRRVGEIKAPTSKPETKAFWKLSRRAGGGARPQDPRLEKQRASPTARRLRGGSASVPAAGVGDRSSRPARRGPPCALEQGGGRRRHNRKFMAWVTCFPLPQWGPVTLNRKLMREERTLICPPRRPCAVCGKRPEPGSRVVAASWCAANPHQMLPPGFGLPAPGLGGRGTATLAQGPGPALRGPPTLRRISGGI